MIICIIHALFLPFSDLAWTLLHVPIQTCSGLPPPLIQTCFDMLPYLSFMNLLMFRKSVLQK